MEKVCNKKQPSHYEQFRRKRNEVRSAIRRSWKEYETQFMERAVDKPKVLFSYINSRLKNKETVLMLKGENKEDIIENDSKAGHLSRFFAPVFTNETDFDEAGLSAGTTDEIIESIDFTEEDVRKELLALKEGQTTPRRIPPPPGQHLLPSDEGEGNLGEPPIATLAAAGLRSIGCAGSQGNLRRRWLDGSQPLHLQDEAMATTTQENTSLMFSTILTKVYIGERQAIIIDYLIDGKLLNTRPMKASSEVSKTLACNVLAPNDCTRHNNGRKRELESGLLFPRSLQLRTNHQHEEDSGPAPTGAKCSLRRTSYQG
ncbi:hypothetical protein SprV_0200799200 [Sparganum proliferum]